MTFWGALVILALIWGVVALVRMRQNSALGYASDEDGNPVGNPQREAELESEVEQLRERIKVLERIATEDREARRIAEEIEHLRDKDR